MDKVEEAVSAGIHAGNHIRPSHWALRWNTRGQALERASLCQPRKVRHLPLLDETCQKLRVHSVDAKDDELLLSLPFSSGSLARGQ